MTNPSSSSSIHHETTALTAIDGVKVSAFVARPEASPKGCVVVVQEIFGARPCPGESLSILGMI